MHIHRQKYSKDYIIEVMLLLLILGMGLKCLDNRVRSSDNRDWTVHTHMHISVSNESIHVTNVKWCVCVCVRYCGG